MYFLREKWTATTNKISKRVFILGPSHHVYFKNVAYLSGFDAYETPFGNLPVDTAVVKALTKHKVFKTMDSDTDEDEHSFEMHAPYIFKVTESLPQGTPKIIPIMISHGDSTFDEEVSSILSKYLADDENTFVVSSDFCHWGARFGYTAYTPTGSIESLTSLKANSKIPKEGFEIHEAIEHLDKLATKVASKGSSKLWKEYIETTRNTICGQHPIRLVLRSIELVREQGRSNDWGQFQWIGYAQSSQVISPAESSVSYASGYAVAE